ncbi:hypothetical protein BDW62DRAFT_195334 [Aspergillus aurantiobrunneus]
MPVTFFTSFHLISSTHITYTDRKCVAYKANQKRCGNEIPSTDLPRLHALHDKLCQQDWKHIENDKRAESLEDIADICLCWHHRGKNYMKAARLQWEDEIQSRASNVYLDAPEPPSKKRGNCLKLEFESYRNHDIETHATGELIKQLNWRIDKKISVQLIEKLEKKSDRSRYLYIFGHKDAPGVYKVGHSTRLQRMNRDHEKCYPDLVLYSFSYCPNAEPFEKVVHAAFGHYRRQHRCDICNVMHQEWFEAPLEDIVYSVNTWSLFSRILYRYDTSIKMAELEVPVCRVSSDRTRWHNWALRWAERWSRMASDRQHNALGASAIEQTNEPGGHLLPDQRSEKFSSPVPELSPSSAPDTPDDNLMVPATPTPGSRMQRGGYKSRQYLRALEASPTKPTDSLFAMTGARNGFDLTSDECTGTDPGGIFWSSPAMDDCSKSTLGPHTPGSAVYNLDIDMPSTPTPGAINRKRAVSVVARNSDTLVNFAGVTGRVDLSHEEIEEVDILELAQLLQDHIFF